jgi:uroporphyrinogen-III decarboxylase
MALTPNLGYAAAISHRKLNLIYQYEKALNDALSKLGRVSANAADIQGKSENNSLKTTSSGGATLILLSEDQRQIFYAYKKTSLKEVKFPDRYVGNKEMETGEYRYESYAERLEAIINKVKINSTLQTQNLKKCIEKKGNALLQIEGNFPPVSLLIADNKMAILFYNSELLSPEPIALRGHVTHEQEEISFLRELVPHYVSSYTG